MSRAYRLSVRESLRRVLRASDHVSTHLELLEILPPEQMARLLEQELAGRGFQREGQGLVRRAGGVTVTVDPASGTVTVQAEGSRQVELEEEKQGRYYEDYGPMKKQVQESLREGLRKNLEEQASQREAALQAEVTGRLEAELGDLRRELDQVVNRVTAEALKRKAAQMGQIKEITEDPQSGSMTIVLEV